METVGRLPDLDPVAHAPLYELALYDPNPNVQARAERMSKGKGFRRYKW